VLVVLHHSVLNCVARRLRSRAVMFGVGLVGPGGGPLVQVVDDDGGSCARARVVMA
jgi:hypothetical protein